MFNLVLEQAIDGHVQVPRRERQSGVQGHWDDVSYSGIKTNVLMSPNWGI